MAWFEKALEAKVMSTHLLIRANVSKKVLLQAHKLAIDFENRYSAYKEDSFLNTINCQAHIIPLAITPEDYQLFQTALDMSAQTQGAFDITIGALSHATYHYGFANQSTSTKIEIKKQKKLVNYKNIVLTQERIFFKQKGMRLDLGGIGKGYTAKKIALFLAQQGASKILVDVGGEIVTRGKSYTIALNDPYKEGNIAYIKTSKADISISTSGSYERFIDEDNHHILDHTKGCSNHYYTSMSILQNSWNIDKLDAYATALFNQPKEMLSDYCDTFGISVIAIEKDASLIEKNTDTLHLKSLQFL